MVNSGQPSLTTTEEGCCSETAAVDDTHTVSTASATDQEGCDLTGYQRDVLTAVATLVRITDSDTLPLGRDVYDRLTTIRTDSDDLNRSHTYQTLRWLESHGLIDSQQSGVDSRANEYRPTDRGMAVLDALAARYAYVTDEQCEHHYSPLSSRPADGNTEPTDSTESPMRSDGGSVAPSSASTVRSTRARGVAKTLRNHLAAADRELIDLSTAARVTDTTERLCREAVDARSEWFAIADSDSETDRPTQISLTTCGSEAATDDPYFDPDE